MSQGGDGELLSEYARGGSHAAFGGLVARYAGLVYSAAMRHVREAHAAEDVAQAVFIVLARRAATLKPDCVLGGWLLAVTRHAARDYLKMERRRKQREQAVAAERDRQSGGGAGAGELDATLDDALARLSGGNRDVIVLRFLQEKSFGEISALLGISEESARQRTSRALEKLRTIMSRKSGAEVSTTSLGAMLAVAATTTPPAGLVVKLTTTALGGGAAAGVPAALAKGAVTVMAYSKVKAVAVGVLAFLLVGGGAASVGYYVIHGDEPTTIARPDPVAPASRNAIPDYGYNWGVAGAPASRPVYQGPPVAGLVLNPDGKPASGAEISYSSKNVYASVYLPGSFQGRYTPAARTNTAGRFQLVPRGEKPDSVAVWNDQGVGWANAASLPNTPITIVPWGRIEGVAKIGKNPAANARVGLRSFTRGNGSPPLVYVNGSVQADGEGRFVFEKAPPGSVDLDITVAGQQRSVVTAQVEVHSGSTASVAMGGTGRPVIGRVNPVPANATGWASLRVPLPRPPQFPTSATTMPVEERAKILAAYRASPEYQAYINAQRRMAQPIQSPVSADGKFRIEDVPAGTYQLYVQYSDNQVGSSNFVENVGSGSTTVNIPEMPGGRSDDPLDAGEIKLQVVKHLDIGGTMPELAGKTSDGKSVKLSDFKGKYVIVAVSRFRSPNGMAEMNNCVALHDLYRGDPRLAFVSFVQRSGGMLGPDRQAGSPGVVDWPNVELATTPPTELTITETIVLVDPQGKLLAKNLRAPSAVAKVEEILGPPAGGSVSSKVTVAHLPVGTAEGTGFGSVPPVSATNAATAGTFSVVDGRGVEPADAVNRLKDGRDVSGDDAPSQCFFFELGTLEGRLKLDLGRVISVAQVNTYSRHKGDRAPQVYMLYASDGSAAGFDSAPKIGVDPATVGWTKIAVVDTRVKGQPVGGRYAVGISGAAGLLGKYRYLLFEIFPSETRDPYGQAFYSEIDVVEGR